MLTGNLKYSPVPCALPSPSLLAVRSLLILSTKSGQIPVSKPMGQLGTSRAYIHVSCPDGQAQRISLMPTCAKEKPAFAFPSERCFPRGVPAPSSDHRKPLPARRRESGMGQLQGGFGKSPVIARLVPR